MRETSGPRRLIGRILIGAVALALPATATISYAASDAPVPPAAPLPPAPPAAPAAPGAKPHVHKRIVIIDGERGDRVDEAKLQTRVITKDNRTIVLKSTKPLSDAEVEERLGRLENEDLEPSAADADREADAASTMVMVRAEEGDRNNRRRIVIRHREGNHEHADALALSSGPVACTDGVMTRSASAGEGRGGPSAITIVCGGKGGVKAHALDGIRRARQSISEDANLSDSLKERIMKALDEQIEQLSKDG